MCRLDHPLILDPVAPPAGPGGLGVEHGEAGAGAKSMSGEAVVGKLSLSIWNLWGIIG